MNSCFILSQGYESLTDYSVRDKNGCCNCGFHRFIGTSIPICTLWQCNQLYGDCDKDVIKNYEQIDIGIENILLSIQELSGLTAAVNTLISKYQQFNNGLVAYTKGYEKIVSGYSTINQGITELTNGIALLHENTKDIDVKVNNQMDDTLSAFQGSDFEPVSILSPENTKVGMVQFVMKTDAI